MDLQAADVERAAMKAEGALGEEEVVKAASSDPLMARAALAASSTSVAPAKSPEVTMLVKVTAVPPVFDAVTVCVALVAPTA